MGESMNVRYTAPKDGVYNILLVVTLGRGERQWKPKSSLHCTLLCLERVSQTPPACV